MGIRGNVQGCVEEQLESSGRRIVLDCLDYRVGGGVAAVDLDIQFTIHPIVDGRGNIKFTVFNAVIRQNDPDAIGRSFLLQGCKEDRVVCAGDRLRTNQHWSAQGIGGLGHVVAECSFRLVGKNGIAGQEFNVVVAITGVDPDSFLGCGANRNLVVASHGVDDDRQVVVLGWQQATQ